MIVLWVIVTIMALIGAYYWGASDGRYVEAEETKELRAMYEKKIKDIELQASIDSINGEGKTND